MKTITVEELIERLKTLPADSRVRLSEAFEQAFEGL